MTWDVFVSNPPTQLVFLRPRGGSQAHVGFRIWIVERKTMHELGDVRCGYCHQAIYGRWQESSLYISGES